MSKELRILILEDVPTDAELNEHELRKAEIAFSSRRVDTREDFIQRLDEFAPDIILADYKLPAFDGLSALEIAKEKSPDVPFIFVTGAMGEELAVETFKRGAIDYVLKDKLFKLAPAVKRALQEAEEHAGRKQAEERFRAISDSAQDAIIMIDDEMKASYWNPAAERIFGYKKEDAIGKDLHKLIVPARFYEDAYKGFSKFRETGEGAIIGKTKELAALRKDGTEFYGEHSISAVKIKGKWHAIGIVRDITERKRLENKLKEELDIVERMNKLMVGRELELEKRKQTIKKLEARVAELEEELKKGK